MSEKSSEQHGTGIKTENSDRRQNFLFSVSRVKYPVSSKKREILGINILRSFFQKVDGDFKKAERLRLS